MLKSLHILSVSYAVEVSASAMVDVMVLETNLHLNSRHPDYDRDAVNALVSEARAYLKASASHVSNIRLVTTWRDEI